MPFALNIAFWSSPCRHVRYSTHIRILFDLTHLSVSGCPILFFCCDFRISRVLFIYFLSFISQERVLARRLDSRNCRWEENCAIRTHPAHHRGRCGAFNGKARQLTPTILGKVTGDVIIQPASRPASTRTQEGRDESKRND